MAASEARPRSRPAPPFVAGETSHAQIYDAGTRFWAAHGGPPNPPSVMGNCASAMDGLIPWGWGAKATVAAPANPAGMSASKRTTSSSTTATTIGNLSTVSTSTFMASTVSGGSTDEGYAEGGHILESPNLRIFTFAELRSACKNFRAETVLGEGVFGKVYKGWVDMNPAKGSTAMVVTVKKLNP